MKQTTKHVVRLGETDAAGRLYFASAFTIAHAALEDALALAGFPIAGMLKNGTFILPIVHAEADYKRPLIVGEKITIHLTLKKKGPSTLKASSILKNADGKTAVRIRTIHACIDQKSGRVIRLPKALL